MPREQRANPFGDYHDTGCFLFPACLKCPLPVCYYEETAEHKKQLRQGHYDRRVKHGTRAEYLRGCRCRECTDANTAYFRQRREKVLI